jgi:hypothetical protein
LRFSGVPLKGVAHESTGKIVLANVDFWHALRRPETP